MNSCNKYLSSLGISHTVISRSMPDLLAVPARTFCVLGYAYLHCTAGPSSLWHRNTHRGLGDRTRRTCIPLVHYTFLYKFCQMCAVHKLGGRGEKDDSESNMQPLEMHDSSFKGDLLDQWIWKIIQSQLWHEQVNKPSWLILQIIKLPLREDNRAKTHRCVGCALHKPRLWHVYYRHCRFVYSLQLYSHWQ